jgi:signal transduction histidine kinase/ligand-binding sensor domain-containing protein/DNA-binding response OmpR family regulator
MRNTFLFLLACIPFYLTPVSAQDGRYSLENYTQENGLSNNQTHCIYQDRMGWIWIGTSQGLNRFDGYKYTIYKNDPDNKLSLQGDLVRAIFEDPNGNIWVGTENGGLNKFDRAREVFLCYSHNADDNTSISGNSVNAIAMDLSGLFWIGTENGLNEFDAATGKVIKVFQHEPGPNSISSSFVRVLHIDHSGKLWIGTNSGLDCFNPTTGIFIHVPLSKGTWANDEVHEIYQDPNDELWIGTYNSGMYSINPETFKITRLPIDPSNNRSITVRAITRDNSGNYWIGTRGGLYLYSKTKGIISHFTHDDREVASLCNNSVLDITTDAKGDVWIGTRGGISYINEDNSIFRHYKALNQNNKYLNDNEIYAFWPDKQGNLLIGTERGGVNILNLSTGTFRYLMHDGADPNSLSVNCIKAFLDDNQGNIWIGTYLGGINVLNPKTGKIKKYLHAPEKPSSLADNRVWALFRDSRGIIWVGTERGLDRFDPKINSFVHYDQLFNSPVLWINEDQQHRLWLGADKVYIYEPGTGNLEQFDDRTRAFCMDSRGRIWLTTMQRGLALYDVNKGPVKYYNEKSGIANNQALCIQEDRKGNLWISTANGLSKFNPGDETFRNFDKQDGLQNNQFNYGAGCQLPSDELVFGGIYGFNIFNPDEVKENSYIPPVVFTDFRIFNKPVPIGEDDKAVLKKSISETRQVILPFKQNVITIEFAALNYAKSDKNRYSYMLEGFDKTWSEPGIQRTVTYTNLNPGEYTFRVQGSNNDNKWNRKGNYLLIRIMPPYWKTWWFKTFVLVLILFLIFLLVQFLAIRAKLKHEVLFERDKAKRLHEIDMVKLRFFTNISHEIRTPLTLVIGPLEKMLNYEVPPTETKNYLRIMHRNAQQLLKLINQLLDFRKLETGNLKLELSRGDIISFIKGVFDSFKEFAEEKEIQLKLNTVENEVLTWFDPDKVEKIMNNLLSNALKFTDRGGFVTINVSLVVDNQDELKYPGAIERKFVEIVVKDTGIGIPEESQHKVFRRFFQLPDSSHNTGTGIGLALTKELVELHKGQIFISSLPGKGARFTVRLPFEPGMQHHAEETGNVAIDPGLLSDSFTTTEESPLTEKILLVVEDNPDVRYFIRSHFEPDFKVVEAADGKEGFQQALKIMPDIVVADILMPQLNGTELCKKLKKDERTSHIPVILLTALNSREHELEGLEAGADDYITKPFDISILQTKIDNLFALRKSLKEKYTSEMVLQPSKVTIRSLDEKFLHKAIEVIEKNIGDADFDIEKFSEQVGVSRMQLYRKLANLTGMTVKEFIRDIRLKRAAQLLTQKELTISEIVYAVGFRDLSHFRKCFRQQFGMSASDYADAHMNN